MMNTEIKKWIPLAICLVLGFLLSRAIPPRQPKNYLPELIAEKDLQVRKAEEREKAAEQRAEAFRSLAQQKIDRDTVYVNRLVTNDKKIKAVVSSVDNATKDELRKFVSDY
jgi:Tfp pilus assembly protein PilN